MTEHHQIAIFKAMESPDFYPHAVSTIEQRDTHISKVFLTGNYVYKIKKPINLGFLDFTTLTSSMLQLVRRRKLEKDSIDALAGVLAKYYSQAPASESINTVGSLETVWINCEENFRQTEKFVPEIIDERMFLIIQAATRAFLQRRRLLFQRRVEHGKIRDCHGDLRAGHIYFADGIKIVDCIEFNDRFRYADITSDLAFLAMDLDFEGYPQIAQDLITTYLEYTKDEEMLILLDFYKCYRAYVRLKVNCFHLQEENLLPKAKSKLTGETERFLKLAYRYAVQFTRPTIWVVCGLPAGGKSTIAREMAKILGVQILQSDFVRKQLLGVSTDKPMDLAFESGIYSKEASSLTYGKLVMSAQEVIEKGDSVILDATFSRRHQRDEVIRLARDMDTNIIFIECAASYEMLKKRLADRETTVCIEAVSEWLLEYACIFLPEIFQTSIGKKRRSGE